MLRPEKTRSCLNAERARECSGGLDVGNSQWQSVVLVSIGISRLEWDSLDTNKFREKQSSPHEKARSQYLV